MLPPAPPPPPAAHHPAGHVTVAQVIMAYEEVTPEERASTGRRHKSSTKVMLGTAGRPEPGERQTGERRNDVELSTRGRRGQH
ncbi:hypothetical protein E2C01_081598 [Portunus trituberculatus]|uniref:Uncharacterized protein n=1 Tax=Portunus trituberculatus TaxID=210409 RepID=A0A5B7ISA8_PORTR|nr:hypothetical protein [Portunus trituberculatus]